ESGKEYIHASIGYNYRLPNLQAAVGVAQMEQLPKYIDLKRKIAERYEEGLKSLPGVTLPREAPWAFSNPWLYTILIDEKRAGTSARQLEKALDERHIQARPLWAPLHEQRPYQDCQHFEIEVATRLYQTALSLPSSVNLTKQDQLKVIREIS